MSLKAFVESSWVKTINLDGQDIRVRLATQSQLEAFQAEAATVESSPAANLAFERKWLAILCPEFAEIEGQDIPFVLVNRLFEEALAVSFGATRKNA